MYNFAKNYQRLFLLNTTPGGTETLSRVGGGIDTCDESNNESKEEKQYYNNEGFGTTISQSKSFTYAFSGDRILGDPVQDFVAKLYDKMGGDVETNFVTYDSLGKKTAGNCSITDIIDGGGGAGEISPFGFTVNLNGKPTITQPSAAVDFTTPTVVAAGSGAGTTKATVTKEVTPSIEAGLSLFYTLTAAAVTKNTHQYIDTNTLTAYTSGSDIAATAGQYVTIYGVDENKRVQRIYSTTVVLPA